MHLATLLPRLVQRWWLVAAVAALAALGAGLAVAGRAQQHQATVHFVLRPNSSVSSGDLAGALDELRSDGSLVQTVIGVLGSDELLRRAAADVHLRLTKDYTVASSARPGSALIDSTLSGPDADGVNRLAAGYARAASGYVAASYAAYVLDRLGADPGGRGTGLSASQVVVLALLLGGALGVGLVAAELRLEPRLPSRDRRARAALPASCLATTVKGVRCRNPAVDERGYCLVHLTRLEAAPGNGVVPHALEPTARSRPREQADG